VQHADIVGERYRLDRKIGQGGTGSIWLAYDLRLERRIAIKFLIARDPEHQERLAKRVALEAKIAASVQHPNVVQIFDFGTHQDNIPYIAMEALSGFTLGEAFDSTQAFSLDVVIQVMSDVLRGLAAVHHAGIVHRDLKPENIFLVKQRDGKLSPKLLDFGISRSLEPETRRSPVTTTEGLILGTPQYMSPEQARGVRDIDKRTDIYSLGIVLFEALAGFVPFDSENTGDLLMQVIRDPAPPMFQIVPQIGVPLCHVVDKALAKDRAHRHSDADAMHAALVAAAKHIPAALDRQEQQFPPVVIRGRSRSKRSGFEREWTEEDPPTRSFATRAERASKRLGAAGVQYRNTPAQAEPAVDDSQTLVDAALEPPSESAAIGSKTTLRRRVTWAASSVGLVTAAVAATLIWTDRQAGQDDSGFIVVQAVNPPSTPPASAQEASAPAPAEPELQAKRAAEPKPKKPAKVDAPDPLQQMASEVTRAFARQKTKVIGCLDAHPEDVQSVPQLTVHMTVNADGQASEALLLPETIANKPVSACVTRAVLSMSFPRQAQPTTFRVPLLWRRK